jgi:hypothetical protein
MTGVFEDQIDLATGAFSGTGVVRLSNGDTVMTTGQGQSTPPDANGTATVSEDHTITGGTGRFAGATGTLHIVGSANNAGAVAFTFSGVLSR